MQDGYLNKELFKKVFHDHIAKDIEWAINEKRELVAAQLLLIAIDITAGLCRPAEKEETNRTQFIGWADEHLALEGRNSRLTGTDVYGARCGVLHGYTSDSRVLREGKAKRLAYLDQSEEPLYTDAVSAELVIVSLPHLFQAYLTGLIETMKRINQSEELSFLVNPRLEAMFHVTPLPEEYRGL